MGPHLWPNPAPDTWIGSAAHMIEGASTKIDSLLLFLRVNDLSTLPFFMIPPLPPLHLSTHTQYNVNCTTMLGITRTLQKNMHLYCLHYTHFVTLLVKKCTTGHFSCWSCFAFIALLMNSNNDNKYVLFTIIYVYIDRACGKKYFFCLLGQLFLSPYVRKWSHFYHLGN